MTTPALMSTREFDLIRGNSPQVGFSRELDDKAVENRPLFVRLTIYLHWLAMSIPFYRFYRFPIVLILLIIAA